MLRQNMLTSRCNAHTEGAGPCRRLPRCRIRREDLRQPRLWRRATLAWYHELFEHEIWGVSL